MRGMLIGSVLVVGLFVGGCATNAPKYNTDFDNVAKLRAATLAPVRIGEITKDPASKQDVNSITIRGGTLTSPYGSYTAYLREALEQEFTDARLLEANSQIEISGVLLRNEVDAGISKGTAEVDARLVVKRSGGVAYDDVKTAQLEWGSNFVGAIAIPRANENYPKVLQKLLGEFYADPKFLAALKK
jgi:hypothetical protein